MRPSNIPPRRTEEAGFTLPAILVVVGALLILAVGVLLVVGIERSTARSFSDRQRAELAARAGLEDIKGILNLEAANDDFLVLQSALATPITPGSQAAPQLFLARGKVEGTAYSYRYVPLFSTKTLPQANKSITITPPVVEPLLGTAAEEYLDFTALPYNDKVRASWLPVKDEKDRTVARYAYWVEDLQSRIDPAITGNEKGGSGTHARAAWPFPAPGLNPMDLADTEPTLDQVALYAVDPAANNDSQGDLGKTLIKNRKLLISPDSLLAAAGIEPPLDRLKTVASGKIGELINLKSRAVEEGLSSGLQSYKEQPVVPFAEGIDPSVAGKPKLNLNKLLATGGTSAVDEMADFINKALPKFVDRKGGFPVSEDYVKTLAANAIDYADSDPGSTLGTGYRGLDAYPLVSEFLMRFHWETILSTGGRKYVVLKVATYVELWNMTDQPVSGTAEFTHDTRYKFPLGANPEVSLADMSEVTPVLTKSDDAYWFPPVSAITLKPNEYRMFTCGEVTYKLDAGPSSVFVPQNLLLEGERYGESQAGYKLKWNGQIVDNARGGIHRNHSSLKYPASASGSGKPKATRTTIPGHSYQIPLTGGFINNMGDPRMAYYLSAPQDASAFPENYSPNRRNIRYQIYTGSGGTSSVYGRVMPSEWPDGGHNSTCENTNGLKEKDDQLDPDAAPFKLAANSVLRNPPADESPLRLSESSKAGNVSRYYSATELGRVYDPIQWNVAQPPGANLPWGDVLTSTISNQQYGGGNTLKIGRPEHPMFDKVSEPGMEARRLLDLFHAGLSRSASDSEREGPVIQIQGQVNLNTASRDALRAIAVGALTMDPKMAKRIVETHKITDLMAPQVKPFKMTAAEINTEADRIADAIILTRKTAPFTSPSALAEVRDSTSPTANLVFGNKNLIADGAKVNRTDSAAEEIFARVYEASTVRSRNYRIWVVGQAVAPTTSTTAAPQVLSEVRKVFTVFADPGARASDGKIDPTKARLTILNENDF